MQISPTARVGMLAVVALILMGLLFTQVGHMGTTKGTAYTVVFSDVMGLQLRAPVQFSGVRVGFVSDMSLNAQNQVEVTMFITREDTVLYDDNYFVYTITSDVLGSKWLDIRPGPVPEGAKPVSSLDRLKGTSPVSFDTLARQGNEVLGDLKESIRALNGIVDDENFQSDIKQSVTNFKDITSNLKDASADAQDIVKDLQIRINGLADALDGVVGHVDETVLNFQDDARAMGQDLRSVTGTVRGIVTNNAGNINELVVNLHAISCSLRNTAAVVEKLATDPEIQQDVKGVANNLFKVSEEVAGICQDIRSITSDPNVQEDLRVTLQNVRETSESANRTVKKINRIVSDFAGDDDEEDAPAAETADTSSVEASGADANVSSSEGNASGESVTSNEGNISSESVATGDNGQPVKKKNKRKKKRIFQADISNDWNLRTGKANANINAMLFPDGPWSFGLGVDSIGHDNLVNLQAGRTWDKFRVRGGVIRSQIGIGADAWLFDKRFEASLDVYDTRHVKVDVTGKVLLPKDFYIYGGVRDITSRQGSYPMVGVGKRF